jgi:hypothetical protein
MTLCCPSCASSDLRTSRFRRTDIRRLFLLKVPLRCRICRERYYAPLLETMAMRKTREPRKA